MRDALGLIRNITLLDLVDIAAVAGLLYLVFSLLRGTRSMVALRGVITVLFAILIIYLFANLLGLTALSLLLEQTWIVIVLVFLVIFQNEFKKAVTGIGQLRLFRAFFTQSGEYLGEVVKAVRVMANRHVGALIVLERRNSLRACAETGTQINATVSAELIRTIFTPYSPLHDGAVIISRERLVAASTILPLTTSEEVSKDLGTRHRAGLGLSEETDAIVIIVSEETGAISIAIDGALERGLKPQDLRRRLQQELGVERNEEEEDTDAAAQ